LNRVDDSIKTLWIYLPSNTVYTVQRQQYEVRSNNVVPPWLTYTSIDLEQNDINQNHQSLTEGIFVMPRVNRRTYTYTCDNPNQLCHVISMVVHKTSLSHKTETRPRQSTFKTETRRDVSKNDSRRGLYILPLNFFCNAPI